MKRSLTIILSQILIMGLILNCNKKQKARDNPPDRNENTIQLNPREQVLINLKTDRVKFDTIYEFLLLSGRATVDETKITTISARIEGRIEELFVKNTGARIKVGDPLYSIYSEELLAAQNEYLLGLQQKNSAGAGFINDLILAAKNKLLLWGMNKNQIEELETSGSAKPAMVVHSNSNGYITELNISRGTYVIEGTPLFKIAQSSTVWVEAQIFPHEIKYLSRNPEITVQFEAFPQKFSGHIIFIPPAIEQGSSISILKIEISNQEALIRPGMFAAVTLIYNKKTGLIVPNSAIIAGEMPMVWIEKDKGIYERAMVHIGTQNKSSAEILHGLNEGDRVVTSGAYLINSEYILKKGATEIHQH